MATKLFVTLAFIASPFLSLGLVVYGLFRDEKYRRYYGFLLSIVVGLLMYKVMPTSDMDLWRYYDFLSDMSTLSPLAALTQIWQGSDPLSYSFIYIVGGALGSHAVPLIESMVTYGIFFFILFDYAKNLKLQARYLALVSTFFFSIYSIVNTFSGIRFGLAISLFALAVYLDIVKNKKPIARLLYLLTPLFHTSMITLLLVRVIAGIFRQRFLWLQLFLVALVGLSTTLLLIVSRVLTNVPFLSIVAERADFYLNPEFPSGTWYPFNVGITLILLALLVIAYRKRIKPKERLLLKLNLYVVVIALSNVTNAYVASRYMTIAKILFSINLIFIMFYIQKTGYFKTRKILMRLLITGFIVTVIAFLGYQYAALRYLDYGGLFPYGIMDNLVLLLMRN